MQVVIGKESVSKWGHGTLGSSKFAFSPDAFSEFLFLYYTKKGEG